MNPFKSLISFLFFLGLFCTSLALRYYYFIYLKSQWIDYYAILFGVLLISGIFLGLAMHYLKIKPHFWFNFIALGVLLGFLGFVGISISEDAMSEAHFLKISTPSSFANLNNHCGVYAGRSLLKMVHHEFFTPQMEMIQEFEFNNTCRNRHYGFLVSRNLNKCDPKENLIDCRVTWMHNFSEHGIWNLQTRKLFNAEVMTLFPAVKNEESLVKYVVEDQELEAGRVSLVRQAGIEEEFADQYIRLHQKDELENLRLSEKIFMETDALLENVKTSPPPYLLKFQDLRTELQPKLARIPEMESDLSRLGGK